MTEAKQSRAAAYRAKNLKTVTVDGIEWTIKKVPPMTLGKIMEITGIKPGATQEEAENAVKTKLFEIAKAILPACTVDPKVSLNPVNGDELSIDDLTLEALNGLLDEIYEFSGLGVQQAAERESFQPKPNGSDGSQNSTATDKAQ